MVSPSPTESSAGTSPSLSLDVSDIKVNTSRSVHAYLMLPVCLGLISLSSYRLFKGLRALRIEYLLRRDLTKCTPLERCATTKPEFAKLVYADSYITVPSTSSAASKVFGIEAVGSIGLLSELSVSRRSKADSSVKEWKPIKSLNDLPSIFSSLYMTLQPQVNPEASIHSNIVDASLIKSLGATSNVQKINPEDLDSAFDEIERSGLTERRIREERQQEDGPKEQKNEIEQLYDSHPFKIARDNNLNIVYSEDSIFLCKDEQNPGSFENDIRIQLKTLPDSLHATLVAAKIGSHLYSCTSIDGSDVGHFLKALKVWELTPSMRDRFVQQGSLSLESLIQKIAKSKSITKEGIAMQLLGLFLVYGILIYSLHDDFSAEDFEKYYQKAAKMISVNEEDGSIQVDWPQNIETKLTQLFGLYGMNVIGIATSLSHKYYFSGCLLLTFGICLCDAISNHIHFEQFIAKEVMNRQILIRNLEGFNSKIVNSKKDLDLTEKFKVI